MLHQGGSENISDSQIIDAMRILNEDYNKQNADTVHVIPYYRNNIADMQLTFRLANIDPNGNYTNGIERIYSSLTYVGGNDARMHQWNPANYLNVWVVRNNVYNGTGYAYYPGNIIADYLLPWQADSLPDLDGIMLLHQYVGSVGTGNYAYGRALTHDVGHYFGLLHPWGESNFHGAICGDDSVSDTPLTKGWNNCPTDSQAMVCTPGVPENYQNFMEYSYCSRMFTNGQKARVQSYLTSPLAHRNNLCTPSNLLATGTNYSTPLPSPPIADFSVRKRFVCLGDTVTFRDASYNGTPTTWQWTFANANITTSNDTNPRVVFNTLGWQSVTLTVSNAQGSSTKTRSLVYVADATAQLSVPYYNSFNDTADFAANWIPMNIDDDSASFQPIGNGAFTNSMAIVLTNFNSHVNGSYDELITPAFNLLNIAAPDTNLSFVYSYATQASLTPPGPIDSLAVQVTTNCGTYWRKIFSKAGAALMNGGNVTSSYIPTQSVYWSQINVPITDSFRREHVRFKLQIWGSHTSNNFYIDDFAVGRTLTGIREANMPLLSVIPNPFNSTIRINGIPEGSYTISVFDITGREVKTFPSVYATDNFLNLDLASITTKGIYILKVTNSHRESYALKLVRE